MTFTPHAERELPLATWTNAVALKCVAEIFGKLRKELASEWEATPRWRLLKRRRLAQEELLLYRLYDVAYAYAITQDPNR